MARMETSLDVSANLLFLLSMRMSILPVMWALYRFQPTCFSSCRCDAGYGHHGPLARVSANLLFLLSMRPRVAKRVAGSDLLRISRNQSSNKRDWFKPQDPSA